MDWMCARKEKEGFALTMWMKGSFIEMRKSGEVDRIKGENQVLLCP